MFARIDHAAGAASVGLPFAADDAGGVRQSRRRNAADVQAEQTAGIDLPLKALVWQDAGGAVNLSYNDPAWIAARHAPGGGAQPAVGALSGALKAFAAQATGRLNADGILNR